MSRRRRLRSSAAVGIAVMALGATTASAAGPPSIGNAWVTDVSTTTARLHGEANPNGLATSYHFSYISRPAYQANLDAGKDPFSGAQRMPAGSDPSIGAGTSFVSFVQKPPKLLPETVYRYRVVAKNSAATVNGQTLSFTTRPLGGAELLLDSRGWEMVSPVAKNGGQVDPPGAIFGGGVLQASADGQSVTYGSAASFGGLAAGAPPASQYVSSRSSTGWSTANVTAPLFSASYGTEPQGVPYRLFSPDLMRGLLLNGEHCRGEAGGCAVANPPLPGTSAPAGYQNYYLRDSASGAFAALLGAEEAAHSAVGPAHFDLRLAGASPDLRHVVLSSCAALSPNATEAILGEGCDPQEQNLYLFSAGTGPALVNVLSGQSQGTPGAVLGAQAGAVSADGSRIYWQDTAGSLYLREAALTKEVNAGPATFQTATPDGAFAFYTTADAHLHRYDADADASEDLTPAGGVVGMLGASADGSYAYYLNGNGLFVWHEGAVTEIAPAADAGNYPPATGSARLSADGSRLAFLTEEMPIAYDNANHQSGKPDAQLFLYDALADQLICVSCNPTNARPLGPASLPGAIANGEGPNATVSYKPRALSANGRRIFFESEDALALTDTNGEVDVYEWEERGEGSCTRNGGCLALVSSGRAAEPAVFVDASSDGSDAFFLTEDSLVGSDPGSIDLYDARVAGGFPEPETPIPCRGNECQVLPPAPIDPTLNTLLAGLGNPPVRYERLGSKRKPQRHRKKGKRHRKKQAGSEKRGRGSWR